VKKLIPVALALLLAAAPTAYAQEKPEPPPAPQGKTPSPQVPLRVQVVVTKLLGEKTLSSVPYSLSVVTDDVRTSLRMGMDVPILMPGTESYAMRPIGTNIDCQAGVRPNGQYRLALTVSDSAIVAPNAPESSPAIPNSGAPYQTMRNFTSSFALLLRDGQTAQHTAATDPVSGETVRIDVTLNVLK
jgi:hypothetical protein